MLRGPKCSKNEVEVPKKEDVYIITGGDLFRSYGIKTDVCIRTLYNKNS